MNYRLLLLKLGFLLMWTIAAHGSELSPNRSPSITTSAEELIVEGNNYVARAFWEEGKLLYVLIVPDKLYFNIYTRVDDFKIRQCLAVSTKLRSRFSINGLTVFITPTNIVISSPLSKAYGQNFSETYSLELAKDWMGKVYDPGFWVKMNKSTEKEEADKADKAKPTKSHREIFVPRLRQTKDTRVN